MEEKSTSTPARGRSFGNGQERADAGAVIPGRPLRRPTPLRGPLSPVDAKGLGQALTSSLALLQASSPPKAGRGFQDLSQVKLY